MATSRLAGKLELRWAVPITDVLYVFKYFQRVSDTSIVSEASRGVCQLQLMAFLVFVGQVDAVHWTLLRR